MFALHINWNKYVSFCRIVTVSSDGHSWDGPLDIDNLMAENRIFEGFHPANPLYCRSKLANALFNLELSKKLRGSGVTTYAVHPGVVQTDIAQNLKFPLSWMMTILTPVLTLFLRSIVEVSFYISVAFRKLTYS